MPPGAEDVGLAQARARLAAAEVVTRTGNPSLSELTAGPLGLFIASAFRVMPRQARSMASVERLLAAGERIVRRQRRLDRLTIEVVAREAGVTAQAAYRYFADIDDLVRLAVRRLQAAELERMLAFLAMQPPASDADLANAVIVFVLCAYGKLRSLPGAMRERLLRHYVDSSGAGLWAVADTVHRVIQGGRASSSPLTVMQIAAALVAVEALARSFLLQDTTLLDASETCHLMRGVFLAALRGHA